MKGVYIFAGVLIVIGAAGLGYSIIAKIVQKMFREKKDKGEK